MQVAGPVKSLRRMVLTPILIGVVLVTILAIGIFYYEFQRQLYADVSGRAEFIAHTINQTAESVSRQGELQRIVTAIGAERDIKLITVVAGQPPVVIATTRNAWRGKLVEDLPEAAVGEDLLATIARGEQHKRFHAHLKEYDCTVPLLLSHGRLQAGRLAAGAVLVGIDTTAIETSLWRSMLEVLVIFLTLGLFIAFFIYRVLTVSVLAPLARFDSNLRKGHTDGDRSWLEGMPQNEIGSVAEALRQALSSIDEANLALRNQKEALDHHAIVSITDPQGIITYVNEKFCAISGFERDELVGRSHRVIASRVHDDAFFKNLWETISAGAVWHERVCNARKDGLRYWIDMTIVPLLEADGAVREYISISTDITGQVAQQEALQKLNRDLAEQTDRSRALAVQADHANQAKSAFLANMSHEIRTPMNGVIGMTNLLRRTALDTEQQSMVETIRSCGDGLLLLINDILDFSKIEAGKLQLEEIAFAPRQAFDEVLAMMAMKSQAKGIRLVGSVATDVPMTLIGDPGRLRQILINLINNAIKFTSYGHVLAAIDVVEEHDGSVELRATVEDTGIGIPADKLSDLFRSFSQVDTSTTREFGGTGLGLAISRQLVELMHGEIGVDSVPGEGSTFWFTLRLGIGSDPGTALTVDASQQRCLVVCPDQSTIDHLCRYTATWSLPTVGLSDADDLAAVLETAIIEQHPFTLLIIEADAVGLADRLRSLGQDLGADMPAVIGLAPRYGPEGSDLVYPDGVTAPIGQPVLYGELHNSLRQVLGVTTTTAATAGRPPTNTTGQAVRPYADARVLVVDDNPVNQIVAKATLAKWVGTTDLAGNGFEAVKALELARYDLVLMDVQMPELNGMEATRRIRQAGTVMQADVPVVALTANAMAEDREACLDAGMDDFLVKPIDEQALAATLHRILVQGAAQR